MNGFLYWSAYNGICETLHMDAAPGRLSNGDGGACGNSLAKASRDANATPDLFMLCARQFLSTAGAHTMHLTCNDPAYTEYSLGFETCRHGDYLYVTRADQETRLAPGMRIAAAGRNTIPYLLKDTAQDIFAGRGTDREDWDLALRMFDDIDVFPGDGHVERLDLRRYPVAPIAPRLACEQRGGACVLTVESLADGGAVRKLIEGAREEFETTSLLVIDLRRCPGEADADAYRALLPYLCDHSLAAREVMGDVDVFTIYSKNNAARLIEQIDRAREHLTSADGAGSTDATGARSMDTVALLDELEADIRAKAAQVLDAKRKVNGLAARRAASELPEVVPSPFEEDELVEVPTHAPRKVALLVGPKTGVGAERLAQAVHIMEKVALVGGATPGAVDYANYVTLAYPDIHVRLTYPISRTSANHAGHGYARTGLPLDVHVAFSPEACTHDIALETALAYS